MLNEGLNTDFVVGYVVLAIFVVFVVVNGVSIVKRFKSKKHKGKRY